MAGKINPEQISSVIISRTDNIGDAVLTLPLVYRAAQVFKNAEVGFLLNKTTAELFCGSESGYNVIKYDSDDHSSLKRYLEEKLRADLVIFAKPDSNLARLFYSLRTKYRVGTAYRWYSFLFNHKVREHRKLCERHESEYNLNLLRQVADIDERQELPYKLLPYSQDEEMNLVQKCLGVGFDVKSPYIVIHPGSRGSARDISSEQFRQLAVKLSVSFPEYKLVYTGTKEETSKVTSSIPQEIMDNSVNLTGILNLRDLLVLIDKSNLFISNSTGPIHIAGAMNKNLIGFYPKSPPVNDTRWRPLGKNSVVLNPPDGTDDMSKINLDQAVISAAKFLK